MMALRQQQGRPRIRLQLLVLWVVAAVIAALTQVPGSVTAAAVSGDPLPKETPQTHAEELVRPATVFVQTNWAAYVTTDTGKLLPVTWRTLSTGVIVDSTESAGHIVTAGHSLDDGEAQLWAIKFAIDALVQEGVYSASKGYALIDDLMAGELRWQVEVTNRDVRVQLGGGRADLSSAGIMASVVEFKPFEEGDIGLLKVNKTGLPVAQLPPQSDIQNDREIIAIGYPFGLADFARANGGEVALTNREGHITSTDTEGQHGPGNLFYEISAHLTPGMSGGPTVNMEGQVVGLASYTEGEAYYIVPSSVISEMLSRHGIKNKLGPIDTTYRKGLANFYDGYYSDAIKDFDQVIDIMPTNSVALEKRAEATERRLQYGDQPKPKEPAARSSSTTTPVALIAGAGGAVVVLTLALFALLWRRRQRNGRLPAELAVDEQFTPTGHLGAQADATEFPGTFDPSDQLMAETSQPDRQDVLSSLESLPEHSAECPQCSWPHDPDAVFCSQCGSRLSVVQIRPEQADRNKTTPERQ